MEGRSGGQWRRARLVGLALGLSGCGAAPSASDETELASLSQAIGIGSGLSGPYRYAPVAGGQVGDSLRYLGDVNGDGFDDLAAGAPHWSNGPYEPLLGRIHVLYGSKGAPTTQFLDGSTEEWTTKLVAPAGDVNGDGYADALIRQQSSYTSHFRDALHLGGPGGLSPGVAWFLDGWNSECIASAGDVTGDGKGDILCLAPQYSEQTWHSELLLFAGTDDGLSPDPVWTYASGPNDVFIVDATGIGDFNGDGFQDVAGLGSCREETSTPVVVFYGSAQGLSPGIGWVGDSLCGTQLIAAGGDLNGDGYTDILTSALEGSWAGNEGGGAGLAFFGAKYPATTPGWLARLPTDEYTRFGFSLTGVGDVDGNGCNDAVVGADYYFNELLGHESASLGRAFLFTGSPAGVSTDAAWQGYETGKDPGYFADDLAPAGDFNGDGFADLAVGDAFASLSYRGPRGMVYVYYGSGGAAAPNTGLVWNVVAKGASTGHVVVEGARSDDADGVAVTALGRGSYGNVPAVLEMETELANVAFDGTGLARGTVWTPTGVQGASLNVTVSGLEPDKGYHSRLRVVYRPSAYTSASHSRWLPGPSFTTACDDTSPDLDDDGLCDTVDEDDDDDGAADASDCAPRDAAIHSGVFDAPGDGIDQDCSGTDSRSCFQDLDHDGYGTAQVLVAASGKCSVTGMSSNASDCDDANAQIHPGAVEIAGDAFDQDCDGSDPLPPEVEAGGAGGQESGGSSSGGALAGSAGSSGSAGAANAGGAGASGASGASSAGDAGASAIAGAAGSSGMPSVGGGGASHAGGAAGLGNAGRPSVGGSGVTPPAKQDSGCSCSFRTQSTHGWPWLLGLALVGLRRRRASSRSAASRTVP